MDAVVFDTLILSRKFEAAGLPTAQAQGMAAAHAETLGEQIVTRRDLLELEGRLDGRSREFELRMDARFQAMDARFQAIDVRFREVEGRTESRFKDLETRMDARFREQDLNMRAIERRLTIRLGTMLAAAVVLTGALMKLL